MTKEEEITKEIHKLNGVIASSNDVAELARAYTERRKLRRELNGILDRIRRKRAEKG